MKTLTETFSTIDIQWLSKTVRVFHSLICLLVKGGHEFYVVRGNGGKLYQECLLCKHRTRGWEIPGKRGA